MFEYKTLLRSMSDFWIAKANTFIRTRKQIKERTGLLAKTAVNRSKRWPFVRAVRSNAGPAIVFSFFHYPDQLLLDNSEFYLLCRSALSAVSLLFLGDTTQHYCSLSSTVFDWTSPPSASKALAKRGRIMAATLCPTMLHVRGKTRQHCCAPRGHKKIFRNTFCVQDTKFVRHKCCARVTTSQHLGNMPAPAMLWRYNVSSFCRPLKRCGSDIYHETLRTSRLTHRWRDCKMTPHMSRQHGEKKRDAIMHPLLD